MAGEGTGLVSKFRMKKEVTPGTKPASGFHDLPITGLELVAEDGQVLTSKVLGARAADDALFLSPIKFSIPLNCELGYTILDQFLYGVMGGISTSGDGLVGGTAFANIITPATTIPTFSVELGIGDLPTTKVVSLVQCSIADVKINFDAGGLGTIDVTILPWKISTADVTAGDTPATGVVTVTAKPLQVAKDATVYNVGVGSDTTYCVASGTISLARDFDTTRACLGATTFKPPLCTSPLHVDYDLTIELEDQALLKSFLAQLALTGLDLKWVGPATGAGSDLYALEFKSSQHTVVKIGIPIKDNGKIKQTVTGKGSGNTGSGMSYQAFAAKCTSNRDGSTF